MDKFAANQELETSLASWNRIKGGMVILAADQLNKILPPEKVVLFTT